MAKSKARVARTEEQQAAAAAAAEEGLVEMQKPGHENSFVHPTCVGSHVAVGWSRVDGEPAEAEE